MSRPSNVAKMSYFAVVVTCSMLVMEGCYSYEPFTRKDPTTQLPGADENILVSLDGGTDIEVRPHHFIEIREPSTLAYGEGERNEHVQQSEFLLEDGSRIRMKDPDCVMVDSSGGPGLWYVGVVQEGTERRTFSGRISFDSISSIQVRRFSAIKTAAFGLSVVAVAALIVEVGTHLPRFGNMGSLGWGQP